MMNFRVAPILKSPSTRLRGD